MKSEDAQALQPLSRFLLDLYRLAREAEAGQFRRAVFPLLEPLIGFDSGWWGVAVSKSDTTFVAQAVLHNLPPAFVDDYAAVAHIDRLVPSMVAHDGTTLVCAGTDPDDLPESIAFDEKYGLHSMLVTARLDADSGMYLFMSVFRRAGRPEFGERERALKELVMPHVAEAWSQNMRWALVAASQVQQAATAVVDERGAIVDASAQFVERLHLEFPQWRGLTLPEALWRGLLRDPDARFRGKHVDVRQQRASNERMRLLHCTVHQAAALTPREEAVGAAFASGRSYKEIAGELALSPTTVRSYLQKCYAKLGVSNKVQLGAALIRRH
jgi:DNA-binding CsgD family transcriptional regulator